MISEDVLRRAAREAGQAVMDSLPPEDQCHHQFSDGFEKKMRRLRRRTSHPAARKVLVRAAGFFLALLLSGTVWLSLDARARDAFFGWLRVVRSTHFTYTLVDEPAEHAEPQSYRPTELPDDWTEIDVWNDASGVTVVYMDGEGRINYFNVLIPGVGVLSVGDTKDPVTVAMQNGTADYYAGIDEGDNNALVWSDEGLLFSLLAQLSQEELVHVAESVKNIK